jgi:hypothetical protein
MMGDQAAAVLDSASTPRRSPERPDSHGHRLGPPIARTKARAPMAKPMRRFFRRRQRHLAKAEAEARPATVPKLASSFGINGMPSVLVTPRAAGVEWSS